MSKLGLSGAEFDIYSKLFTLKDFHINRMFLYSFLKKLTKKSSKKEIFFFYI